MIKKFANVKLKILNPQQLEKSASKFVDKKDPRTIYLQAIVCHSMETNGPNANADAWPMDELLSSYHTLIGTHVDYNHIRPFKIGKNIDAYPVTDPDTQEKYIEALAKVELEPDPELAETIVKDPSTGQEFKVKEKYSFIIDRIKSGDLCTGSLEVDVKESICNICGKVATVVDDYCDHLTTHRLKEFEVKHIYTERKAELEKYGFKDGIKSKAFCINRGITFTGYGIVEDPADRKAELFKIANKEETKMSDKNKIEEYKEEVLKKISGFDLAKIQEYLLSSIASIKEKLGLNTVTEVISKSPMSLAPDVYVQTPSEKPMETDPDKAVPGLQNLPTPMTDKHTKSEKNIDQKAEEVRKQIEQTKKKLHLAQEIKEQFKDSLAGSLLRSTIARKLEDLNIPQEDRSEVVREVLEHIVGDFVDKEAQLPKTPEGPHPEVSTKTDPHGSHMTPEHTQSEKAQDQRAKDIGEQVEKTKKKLDLESPDLPPESSEEETTKRILETEIKGNSSYGSKESAKMTPEAREFISKKIKEIMEDWKKTGRIGNSEPETEEEARTQAIAATHQMARDKGYDVLKASKKEALIEEVKEFAEEKIAPVLEKIVDKFKEVGESIREFIRFKDIVEAEEQPVVASEHTGQEEGEEKSNLERELEKETGLEVKKVPTGYIVWNPKTTWSTGKTYVTREEALADLIRTRMYLEKEKETKLPETFKPHDVKYLNELAEARIELKRAEDNYEKLIKETVKEGYEKIPRIEYLLNQIEGQRILISGVILAIEDIMKRGQVSWRPYYESLRDTIISLVKYARDYNKDLNLYVDRIIALIDGFESEIGRTKEEIIRNKKVVVEPFDPFKVKKDKKIMKEKEEKEEEKGGSVDSEVSLSLRFIPNSEDPKKGRWAFVERETDRIIASATIEEIWDKEPTEEELKEAQTEKFGSKIVENVSKYGLLEVLSAFTKDGAPKDFDIDWYKQYGYYLEPGKGTGSVTKELLEKAEKLRKQKVVPATTLEAKVAAIKLTEEQKKSLQGKTSEDIKNILQKAIGSKFKLSDAIDNENKDEIVIESVGDMTEVDIESVKKAISSLFEKKDGATKEASVFDKVEKIMLGEGYEASKEADTNMVVIKNAKGEEVCRVVDAFGDDMALVIRFFNDLLKEKEKGKEKSPQPDVREQVEIKSKQSGVEKSTREEELERQLLEIKTKEAFQEKVKKVDALVASMIEKGLLQEDESEVNCLRESGESIISARAKAFKNAVDQKRRSLLRLNDIALKEVEATVKSSQSKEASVSVKLHQLSQAPSEELDRDVEFLRTVFGLKE